MNIIHLTICFPVWLFGYLTGYFVRPFLAGFWTGFYHVETTERGKLIRQLSKEIANTND